MNKYTERTLTKPGWYWHVPEACVSSTVPPTGRRRLIAHARFTCIDEDAISGRWLQCKAYAGSYFGPIDTAAIEAAPVPTL